eukprot:COSAG02_NODE_6276_length_3686_cov_2.296627_1_plen_68_part_00
MHACSMRVRAMQSGVRSVASSEQGGSSLLPYGNRRARQTEPAKVPLARRASVVFGEPVKPVEDGRLR